MELLTTSMSSHSIASALLTVGANVVIRDSAVFYVENKEVLDTPSHHAARQTHPDTQSSAITPSTVPIEQQMKLFYGQVSLQFTAIFLTSV